MPELPEVEVTRRRIAPLLLGREIAGLRTSSDSPLFLTPVAELRRRLRARCAATLERVGKYLLVGFDDDSRLLIHLGMTGQLFGGRASSPRLLSATARAALVPEQQLEFKPDRHTHLQFRFSDGGASVYLRDVRKFGKVLWLRPGESHPRLDRLGRDALEVTGAFLFQERRSRKTTIKALLLNQACLAGVGNIYADEALFAAGVRPSRRAARVTRSECEALAVALRRILGRSIETGGSSIRDYVAPDGRDGGFQDERRVYARAGESCYACGSPICKRVVAQRGTHYCPSCQR